MKAKILVVDDSGMARRTLRRILEPAGFDVVEAEDGIAAIERYFLERPDLVMLDMVMQGLSGLETLGKLREIDARARVIVATADIQHSTREMAAAAGSRGLVNKPFTADAVLKAVNAVLEGGPDEVD
jgi:two-component system chemotaxis response regulator CheY